MAIYMKEEEQKEKVANYLEREEKTATSRPT